MFYITMEVDKAFQNKLKYTDQFKKFMFEIHMWCDIIVTSNKLQTDTEQLRIA